MVIAVAPVCHIGFFFRLETPKCDRKCNRHWFEVKIVKKLKILCIFERGLYKPPCFFKIFSSQSHLKKFLVFKKSRLRHWPGPSPGLGPGIKFGPKKSVPGPTASGLEQLSAQFSALLGFYLSVRSNFRSDSQRCSQKKERPGPTASGRAQFSTRFSQISAVRHTPGRIKFRVGQLFPIFLTLSGAVNLLI